MTGRASFGYVVQVQGVKVTLNLHEPHRGQMASHREGVVNVTQVGNLIAVDGGPQLFVLRVVGISFADSRDAHRTRLSTDGAAEPLRHLEACVIGVITRVELQPRFSADSHTSPPLGANAYPMTPDELGSILALPDQDGPVLSLGTAIRGGGEVRVDVSALLGRHVAVLGSTGQGKSCLTAAVLQQLVKLRQPRIVVFDVNGEYEAAFTGHLQHGQLKKTVLGGVDGYRIPYVALGRPGLSRLLLPSDRTQRPAMNFALDNLSKVKWVSAEGGASLADQDIAVLFDDCRAEGAAQAHDAIERLRRRQVPNAQEWPPMDAIAALVAESYCLKPDKNTWTRNAFDYGHISPLVNRIKRCLDDDRFRAVVHVEARAAVFGGGLDWHRESDALVEHIFGGEEDRWKVHVVDLRHVVHDLMPLILGALLELLAAHLFAKGPGTRYPTLLVLEEAHHYLRQVPDDSVSHSGLAYERLAKEGRKFGLSLWLSTQRPSEVSPTVFGQCGTWIAFRLTGRPDLDAVSAAEWIDKSDVSRISGLPRRQAIAFGSSLPIPTRIESPLAEPLPHSVDPDFSRWSNEPTVPLADRNG